MKIQKSGVVGGHECADDSENVKSRFQLVAEYWAMGVYPTTGEVRGMSAFTTNTLQGLCATM